MKQTAVEWLQKKLIESGISFLSEEIEYINQAKEMEKEQIIDAYDTGIWDVGCRNSDSEKYYHETYGDK
jgi:hypothetical protein